MRHDAKYMSVLADLARELHRGLPPALRPVTAKRSALGRKRRIGKQRRRSIGEFALPSNYLTVEQVRGLNRPSAEQQREPEPAGAPERTPYWVKD